MKSSENTSNETEQKRQSHEAKFTKVLDGRKQPIKRLWKRNERFYAQMVFEDPFTGIKKTKRVALLDKDNHPVRTVAQAVVELRRLETYKADKTLGKVGRKDRFCD